ncbi:MAG TPA: magnesium/cobalt transporter CorA [Candidatus Micrarchaeaceae archaeon]|nr:magnesium/cobalt transporter CorA [Candidatus Micrarchaeaceae archaeon]
MRTLITTKGASLDHPSDQAIAARLQVCHEDGFWLDIQAPDGEDLELLEKVFGFHHLTIEDIKHQDQRPKLEEYHGYTFIVIFTAQLTAGQDINFHEHHLFVSKDYLVTVHDQPAELLVQLVTRIKSSPELTKGNPGFLQYLVIDQLVDSLFPLLETLDDRIDNLEDQILQAATPELLADIYKLKHQVIELRKFIGAQRDLFQRLITHSMDIHGDELTLYWRDVHDHLIRQYETVDSLRDLLTGAMDVYLSTVSNRLNNTMKTLTVIASIFLPISFLTGFYGMNFLFLTSILETPYKAFFVGAGTMVASVLIQLYYFRRRGWI